jgi:hypothetical protein
MVQYMVIEKLGRITFTSKFTVIRLCKKVENTLYKILSWLSQ